MPSPDQILGGAVLVAVLAIVFGFGVTDVLNCLWPEEEKNHDDRT